MDTRADVGVRLIVMGAFYLMAALLVGFFMGVTEDHSLASVHSHAGLLGWATMAASGLVYLVLPACGRSRLAPVHFWLHSVGLPVMLLALAALATTGDTRVEPLVGLGSALVVAALLVFTVNVMRNGRRAGAVDLSGV